MKSKNFNSDPTTASLFSRKGNLKTFNKNLQGHYKRGSVKEKIIHKNYKKKKGSMFSNSNELGAQKARDNKSKELHLEIALRTQNMVSLKTHKLTLKSPDLLQC